MATTRTEIEWADATWSPILGCTRVSSGCDGCYAIRTAHIRAHHPNPKIAAAFEGLTHQTGDRLDWTGRVNVLSGRLTEPMRRRTPLKWFVNSQSDLFHEQIPDEAIAAILAVVALTPRHTYQVLTKRHGRMRALLSSPAFRELCEQAEARLVADESTPGLARYEREQYATRWWSSFSEPLPNLWLGVSVEDQKAADMRIPALLATPAAVRWISAEPLIGPIDLWGKTDRFGARRRLTYWLDGRPGWGEPERTSTGMEMCSMVTGPRLDWVVAGGESGPGARPAHPNWFRSLRDQCAHSGVPYLFKQWGQWSPQAPRDADGRIVRGPRGQGVTLADDGTVYRPGDLDPDGLRHREALDAGHDLPGCLAQLYSVGKKQAGRELDGRRHDGYPAPRRTRTEDR
ncbi:phage Gp37/Gp68 family protein [Streptomyces goshikiensis]|uniref:phage Gp37/Gp68 family protein n=1 Tax=Streptomyces goshikiensis TaxID=1942 RepID=UPI00364A7E66